MQVGQNLPERIQSSGLSIEDTVLFTEGFDDFSGLTEVVPGHGREEVVFDLIVEAAIPEIDKGVGLHVSSGKNLVVQVVQGVVPVGDEHTLVVWGKYQGEVKAEKHLMDHGKGQNLQRTE